MKIQPRWRSMIINGDYFGCDGEKFLFDIGTGSMGNIASLMIPLSGLRQKGGTT